MGDDPNVCTPESHVITNVSTLVTVVVVAAAALVVVVVVVAAAVVSSTNNSTGAVVVVVVDKLYLPELQSIECSASTRSYTAGKFLIH